MRMKIWQAGMPTQPKTCFNWCSCPLIPLKVAQLRAQLTLRYTELLKLFREAIWGGKDPMEVTNTALTTSHTCAEGEKPMNTGGSRGSNSHGYLPVYTWTRQSFREARLNFDPVLGE